MVPRGLGTVLPSRGVRLARGKVQYTYSQGRAFIAQQSTSTLEYFCPSLQDQLSVNSEYVPASTDPESLQHTQAPDRLWMASGG
jgi:hypothetical protein